MKRFIYQLFTFLLFFHFFSPQTNAQQVSTEGKVFWVAFMDIAANSGGITQQLFITSKVNTSLTVKLPNAVAPAAPWSTAPWSQFYTVTAGLTTVVTLPNNSYVTASEAIQNKGVYVTAQDNISVFAVQKNTARTEASVVLPVASFGGSTEYIINTFKATNSTSAVSRTEFIVVAMKNATSVIITPTVNTRGGKPAGTPFTVLLDSGQVYQVQSKTFSETGNSNTANNDLTGTTVVGGGGCKPFSVFSGATAVQVPDASCSAWQHLYEQNYPVKTWGKDYLVIPYAGMPKGYAYKILASENNTAVLIKVASNPVLSINLNKGQFYEGYVDETIPFAQGICITADKAINVAQFMKGQSCNGASPTNNRADPSMLILNPSNQTVKKVTFNTVSTPSDALTSHYVNIIIKNSNIDKIKLQGSFLATSNFTPVQACTGYSYAMIDLVPYGIDPNIGSPFTLESDSAFIAYAYGYGNASAYAYSAGASFENQLYNFNTSAGTVCIGTTVAFAGFGTNVTSYTWDFGDGSPIELGQNVSHLYTSIGTYSVKMTVTTTDGCGADYIIKPYQILPFPAPTLGTDKATCPKTSTILNPANATLSVGSPTYKWYRDGVLMPNTTATLTVSIPATYKVSVTNAGTCSGEDEVVITNHVVGAVDIINLNTAYCINNPNTTLQGTPAGGSFTVKGAPSTVFNPIIAGLGTHQVIYTYTDANTCVNRDTMMVAVNQIPTVVITGLQNEYCATNTRVSLAATPIGGTFNINSQVYTNNNIKLDSLGAGTYTIVYSYTDGNTCLNTTSKTVVINPLPVINFTNVASAYCVDDIPLGFLVAATPLGGITTIDGVATTLFNPKLLGVGNHTIVYTYTDNKNCVNSKTQVVAVNPLPTPLINLQDAYCKGQGIVSLVATPAGGTFTIDGNPATEFNTVLMNLGDYEVIYTYQDLNSCLNRDTLVFSIEPSPIVEITGLQFIYCIDATPFNLTATPHPINPDGIGIFRIDGGAPVTQVTPSLVGAGIHTVEYTYIDNRTNCIVVKTKDFEVSGLPAVSLVSIGGLQNNYCLNSPAFSLTGVGNPSGGIFTVSGIIRAVFDPIVIGAGTHTVIYNYQDINGCFNTASKDVVIFAGEVPLIPNLKNNYCVQNPTFNLIGQPVGGTFRIDGALSVEANPLFSPSVLGVGEHIIVYKNLTACDSTVRRVNIYDAPEDVTYTGLDMCSFSGDTVVLDAGLGATYLWSNLKTTRVIKVIQSGKYTVVVADTLGCTTTSDINIIEKCEPKFFIPNTFTPNGDGLNDVLKIFGQDFYKMELKVFNRWGEQVFYTTKREDIWDGRVGGNPAPAGVYVCTIRYLERPNAKEKTFTAFVNIIR